PGYEGDGTIPCILIPSGKASVFRQAKENTARSGLSAIAMARQAALLILAVHNIEKPSGPVTHDFYRQALQLDLRDKRDFTESILAAMGGIAKSRLSQIKALLQLSDESLELADRYDLDERRLRPVLSIKAEDQVEMVRQIIQFNLSSKQVQEMCEQGDTDQNNDDDPIPRSTLQLVKLARTVDPASGQAFAHVLLTQEKDVHVARARLEKLKQFILEAEQYLHDK